jgi:hypothetical protein
MRINVNVLLGILLCVLLVVIGGTMYRMSEEEDTWRPNDIYTHVGDVSSADMPTYSHSHSSDEVAVVLRELSRPSRRYAAAPAFSYAQGYSAPMANSQSPIANSFTGGLYTTSLAMTKSFGSGYGAGAVAPARFARNAEQSTQAMQAMPSVPSLADFSTSSNPLFAMNTQYSTPSASPAYIPMGMQGRRRIGIQDNYLGWLDNKWNGGKEGLTYEDLRKLYIDMTGDTDFANEEAWIAFWKWFQNSQSDDFAWKLVPLSDATWFVLLLCMMYAVVVYRKAKASKASTK